MRRHGLTPLLLIVGAISTTCRAAPSCQPPSTVQLRLGSCILMRGDGSNDVFSWGAKMGVAGSSELCIAPSTAVNSTFLTAAGICDSGQLKTKDDIVMTFEQCQSRRGGFIDPTKVPSANVTGLEILNDGWTNLGNTIDAAVSATLLLPPRESVTMVEGLINKGQESTQSHLGLASGSALIETLKDTGMIGARSYGLNSGSQSIEAPRPGSLVLGGYDSASLLDGQFYEFDIKSQLDNKRFCPLQVPITSFVATLTPENKTSTNATLVSNIGPLTVCLEPYDNLFRMDEDLHVRPIKDLVAGFHKPNTPFQPQDYEDTLLNLEPGIVYPKATGNYNITLRITVRAVDNQNLSVEIPDYEFLRPLRGLGKDGKPRVDDEKTELQIYGSPPSEDSPVFGRIFLSQLYLYVDYESMKFYLARQDPEVTVPVPVSSANCTILEDTAALSGTAKGLIGVGVVVGVLLLLLALERDFFWKWVLRQPKVAGPSASSPTGSDPSPDELPAGDDGHPISLGPVSPSIMSSGPTIPDPVTSTVISTIDPSEQPISPDPSVASGQQGGSSLPGPHRQPITSIPETEADSSKL